MTDGNSTSQRADEFRYTAAMSSDEVTIYHNPSCGTSRNTLALIREAGIEPKIVEYLKTPADKKTLRTLLAKTKLTARELMREKEVEKLGLGDSSKWSDEEIIDQMAKHPILMNRPIVVTARGAVLSRPSETVLKILPSRS